MDENTKGMVVAAKQYVKKLESQHPRAITETTWRGVPLINFTYKELCVMLAHIGKRQADKLNAENDS